MSQIVKMNRKQTLFDRVNLLYFKGNYYKCDTVFLTNLIDS